MMRLRERVSVRDEGSALVAAVAVAAIGMALSAVVVAQAISSTSESARDRVRMIEVHSAESGLDAAMSEFTLGAPCPGPDWSPVEFGSGTTKTIVTVTIEYADANGPLTCTAGVLSGIPTGASITSTATSASDTDELKPVRSMQAEVELTPHESTSPQTAIYSAGNMHSGNGFRLRPGPGVDVADVWIDSGNYTCRQDDVLGTVYLLSGDFTVSNTTCKIDGDLWVGGNYFQSPATPSGQWQITGSLTTIGHMVLSNPTRIQGGASVGGNIYDGQIASNKLMTTSNNKWKNSLLTPFCSDNIGGACAELPMFEPMGMPRFDFVLSEWQPVNDPTSPAHGQYFTYKTKEDFAATMISTMGITGYRVAEMMGNPCAIPGSWVSGNPISLPGIELDEPTIYDMRDCASTGNNKANRVESNSKIIKVYSDIMIMSNGFRGSNGFTFESGDGAPHNVWLVVPSGSGDNGQGELAITVGSKTNYLYTPGNMEFASSGLQTDPDLNVLLYTPKLLSFPNSSTFRGQLYGGTVSIDSGAIITYTEVGLPGMEFIDQSSSTSAYSVAVVNKLELRN